MKNKGRIVFDTEKLKNANSGLGQFCLHLGKALLKKEKELFFYLPAEAKKSFGTDAHYFEQRWWHKLTGIALNENDIWHATHQTGKYFPKNKKTKIILTVHDLNFLYKYSGSKLKNKKRELQKKIDRASAITAISNFTKSELEKHMDLKGKSVTVIHNGNSMPKEIKAIKPTWINDQPFLFTIGIFSERKNFHVLLPMLNELKEFQLIIAGDNKNEYGEKIKKDIVQLNLKDRVKLPGKISDEEKKWLYQNCEAFLFPSLAEGFGFPVVEAMSEGKPVFCNEATSLPEIGGSHAYYWKNFGTHSMAQVFRTGMTHFKENNCAEQCIEHSLQFSWENAAEKYMRLYEKLLTK